MASRRGVWLFAFVFVALLINLPVAHTAWTRHRLAENGINTSVEVIDAEGVPDDDPEVFFVTYKFSEDIDPEQNEFSTEVDEETFTYAETSDQLQVRYLEGKPGAHVVEGQVTRRFQLVLVALGDLALLAFFILYLKFGRRDNVIRLLATSDIERSRSAAYGLSQVSGDEWVVTGEITKIVDDVVTMVTHGNQEVQVTLGEHESLVGYQQPCQVRGRELPS